MPWPSGLPINYHQYAKVQSSFLRNGVIDLSRFRWIYPTTLLPSVGLIINNPDAEYVPPREENVAAYIDHMLRYGRSYVPHTTSYIPIVSLPSNEGELDGVLHQLYCLNNNGREYGGINAFKYLVGELVTNIYEHSGFDVAFVMAQKYPVKGFVDISFYDDGVTIPGSLARSGLNFENDVEAISRAVNGLSSKKEEGRGYGLQTNIRICAEGLGARILIISRNGILYFDKEGPKGYILRDEYKLSGTGISMRLPYPAQEVDICGYLQ